MNIKKIIIVLLVIVSFVSCKQGESSKLILKDKNEHQVKRFFSDDSFWNQPLGINTPVDPRSDYWISLLDRDPSGENIGLNVDNYTIPIYEIDSKKIPLVQVKTLDDRKIENNQTKFGHEPEFDNLGVPMPDGILAAAGNDKHIGIIDWNTMEAWDMFLVTQDDNKVWTSATGMKYSLDGPGTFKNSDFDVKINESIHGYGPGVAAGIPIIAGLIRYDEVMSGKIRHKLCGALRFVAFQEYVYPATWTDGNFDGGIPEGATLQLDPALDLSQFDLTKEELVVAEALQEYGFVIVDYSVGSTIRAEWLGGNKNKSWEGKLRGWSVPGGIKTIPVINFRVIKIKNIQKGGDRKKEFFMKSLYFEGEPKPNLTK